nr:3-isopropylmalate dehydratase large subunit [uncultured Oscillibacter sp.]
MKGMTITQKILAEHAGTPSVTPGQLIQVKLDLLMANDTGFPISLKEYRKSGAKRVFNRDKIVLVMDHCTPSKDVAAAENCRLAREFALEMGISRFFDVGQVGIEHVLLPEQGLAAPGEVIIGGDSHTCTYGALGAFSTGMGSTDIAAALITGKTWLKVPSSIQIHLSGSLPPHVGGKDVILTLLAQIGASGARYQSLEYTGEGIAALTMDDRFTIANMSIECGAKNGIFPVDSVTEQYLAGRVNHTYRAFTPDESAEYQRVIRLDLSSVVPMVSCPHLPANAKPVSEVQNVKIDQVVIGSCTNGRLSDLAAAAAILKGRRIAKHVRALVIPATQQIYRDAMRLGYLETFLAAGCAICAPGCGPCAGGHMGLLGKGEAALSTSNRNFLGRMGHIESSVYLAGPETAAATAVFGEITGPDQFCR